jgi:transcriptional regulator with XRE-family HTH domain
MKTLAETFQALRIERQMTVTELSRKCKLERSTLWKIETGKPVKAPTLVQALKGLNVKEGSPAFVEIFALWTNEQGGTGKGLPSFYTRQRSEAEEMVRQLLSDIPTSELPLVIKAVSDPAIRAMLPGMLQLRSRQK